MVAYSFKAQFAPAILSGAKRQTIRAPRKRHVREGEALQLYTAMRTKHCRLIGRSTCTHIGRVMIRLDAGEIFVARPWGSNGWPHEFFRNQADMDHFARQDGFESWAAMQAFWRHAHPGVDEFEGVLIQWGQVT